MKNSKYFKEVNVFENGDFFVEIRVSNRTYESWINHKDFGIAMMMFGVMKDNGTNHTTYSQFIDMVEQNMDKYEELYMKVYGEE